MATFNVTKDMVKAISKNIEKVDELKDLEFEIMHINLNDIQRNKKNFYDIHNIDELAEDIKSNRLYHNILVREIGDSKYEIISGERRFSAYKKLRDEGFKKYINIPCNVVKLSDEDAELLLIQANATTRVLSDSEKLKQVEILNTIYQNKKNRGEKVPGRVQKHIADSLGMSQTSVGRLQKINNNLIPELKYKLDNYNLSLSNADEFASLDKNKQKIVNEIIDNIPTSSLTAKKGKELKNTLDNLDDNLDTSTLTELTKDLIAEYTPTTTNIVHSKEIDLKDKINKLNKSILKLITDLDNKNIINFKEGINLSSELEKNINDLLTKINS